MCAPLGRRRGGRIDVWRPGSGLRTGAECSTGSVGPERADAAARPATSTCRLEATAVHNEAQTDSTVLGASTVDPLVARRARAPRASRRAPRLPPPRSGRGDRSAAPPERRAVVPDPRSPPLLARLDHDQVEPDRQPRQRAPSGSTPRSSRPYAAMRDAPASDGRRSPPAARSRATPASALRRSRASPEDPGRPPRDRARGGRHGRSGPGRSNRRSRRRTRTSNSAASPAC